MPLVRGALVCKGRPCYTETSGSGRFSTLSREVIHLRITVEQAEEESLVLRCPDPDAPHIRALLSLLRDADKRIPARSQDAQCFLHPGDVLYAEYVDRNVFLYTRDSVLTTPLSLAELEALSHAFVRCAKAMVVRLGAITYLKSMAGGRILATLQNGEQILISRHYASALRSALGKP